MAGPSVAAFLTATVILLLTPGPVMAILIGNTAIAGRTRGLQTALGVFVGDALLVGALALSVSSSVGLPSALFAWISCGGAVYLLWNGFRALLVREEPPLAHRRTSSGRPFVDGLTTTASNPTTLLFYAAFFTPFLAGIGSLPGGIWFLATLFLLCHLSFDIACVLLVARFRPSQTPNTQAFMRTARLSGALVYLMTGTAAIAAFVGA